MAETKNERETIKAAKNGDNNAFDELIRNYAEDIYRFCFRLTGNRFDAEDLSQEVIVKIYKSLSSFREDSKFTSWAYSITMNSWKNYLRRKNKIKTITLDPGTQENSDENFSDFIADTGRTPEQQQQYLELQKILMEAVMSLSPEKRLPIVLKFMENRSLGEICLICNASVGTVSSSMSRGMKEIRQYLARYLEGGLKNEMQ